MDQNWVGVGLSPRFPPWFQNKGANKNPPSDCEPLCGEACFSLDIAQTPTEPTGSGSRINTSILRTLNLIIITCGRWSRATNKAK